MKKRSKASTKKHQQPARFDGVFLIQLMVGLVVFFSIYSQQLMGPFGRWVQSAGFFLFGDAVSLLPWVLFATAPVLIRESSLKLKQYAGCLAVFLVSFLTFVDSFFPTKTLLIHGEIPTTLTGLLVDNAAIIFGQFGVRFFCVCLSMAMLLIIFQVPVSAIIDKSRGVANWNYKQIGQRLMRALFYRSIHAPISMPMSPNRSKRPSKNMLKAIQESEPSSPLDIVHADSAVHIQPIDEPVLADDTMAFSKGMSPDTILEPEDYVLPPLDLLAVPKKSNKGQMETDMRAKAKVLEITLESFNVRATVVNITIGPSVSRFELQPGDGVKISKITNLSQDIALKLAVPSVRIEAPIPGKALVGIEIPNADISPLCLRSIINPATFYDTDSPLECVLGQRITGEAVTMHLNKMPHILVAGSTGSGKSVCVNAIILSILMKARPDEVKFLMIDPKKVELSLYADIPHLLAPVVTNPHKAAATLKQWALAEMERRYELFTEYGVKDLSGFNQLAASGQHEDISPIPYIVVIIDEFADLMMVASQEVENTICRLAQMARATGIHLVIATQRPSVNVVTGLIKANVPSRISFAVQSQIDSRTVLDMGGAEKLLGRGDMLYLPVGASTPARVQGVFVSEEEVNGVVSFIKKQGGPNYSEDVMAVEVTESTDDASDASSTDDRDELFKQAKEMIQSTQYASTSYLQRKLRIGYNRAARLMDELEEAGVISGYDDDAKTRHVLPTSE